MRFAIWVLAVGLGMGVSAAGAAGAGSIVIRLQTDPAPAGVAWSYSGVGQAFQLRASGSSRTISGLADGTYALVEAPAAGQAKTLTSLKCADPSGGTTVDVSSATATITLSSGETITCTFTHRALGPRPAASAVALAQKYAPVLRLASGERYRPLRLEDYLTRTVLRSGSPPHGTIAQTKPTLFSLPVTSAPTYLDIRGAQPNSQPSQYRVIEQQLHVARPRPTVYFHLAYQSGRGRVAIEYWLLYLYNDFYDQHEADWEGVTVVLKKGAAGSDLLATSGPLVDRLVGAPQNRDASRRLRRARLPRRVSESRTLLDPGLLDHPVRTPLLPHAESRRRGRRRLGADTRGVRSAAVRRNGVHGVMGIRHLHPRGRADARPDHGPPPPLRIHQPIRGRSTLTHLKSAHLVGRRGGNTSS